MICDRGGGSPTPRSAVPLCGVLEITGGGGDAFDLEVPADTIVGLGACGPSARESRLCSLVTEGTSHVRGLLLHERDPSGDDYAYQVLGERSQELTGGFRELAVGRGFERITHDGRDAVIVPAGRYRARLLGDGTQMQLTLRTHGDGSVAVLAAPGAVTWREVAPAYGNSTVGGAGTSFDLEGPSFALFAYGWLPATYVTEAGWGICIYERPTNIDTTAWAPGCPDRVTGNPAFEWQLPPGFGGPNGQGFAVAFAGDTDAFAWGGWHHTIGVRGTQTAVALELELD